MNQSLLIVGVGGVLLGGVGGFIARGGSSTGVNDDGSSSATKTGRTKVVAVETGRREVIRDFTQIYGEQSQTVRVQRLLDYYTELDPALFESEAAKLDELPFSERILASYLLFSQWAEIDPLAALAQTDTMGRTGFFVKPTVLQSWASGDPAAAAQYLQENPRDFAFMGGMGGGRGRGASATIALEWARQDPDAALAWAKGLSGRESQSAVASVIRQVASDDPVNALSMANGLDTGSQEEAHAAIALEWAKEDWDAMESWARGLPVEQRDAALARGIAGLAQRDPEDAATRLLSLNEGAVRDEAFGDVIEPWARQNPKAAMDFLIANGSEAAQESAMREAMVPLARTDSNEALEVIRTLDDNAVRDRAVSTFVFSSSDVDLQEAVQLAATIGDDGSRERTVGIAARRWFREDAEAAESFFTTAELVDADTLQRIKEQATGNGNEGRGRGRRGGR